jgi:ferredoxin
MPAWSSRIATPIGPPIPTERYRERGRSSWPLGRTSPTASQRVRKARTARVARYAWVDHYAPLRAGLRDIAAAIKRAGHRAVAFADDNAIVDREVAHLAGLGWFGKNANLLLPGAGSYFVLGSIITTAEYPASEPVPDGCGTCRRCLDGCPTGAIVAPGVVDANRCLAWLVQQPGTFPVEFREALGDRLYGCDDCQEVCPPSVRLGPRHAIDLDDQPDEVQAWVDVLDLLDVDDDTCSPATAAGTSPVATRCGGDATRSWCSATRATRATIGPAAPSPGTVPTTTRSCASTPTGPPPGSVPAMTPARPREPSAVKQLP